MPIRTISLVVVGAALAGLAGWVGISSVGSIVAPQGDFSLLTEIKKGSPGEKVTAPSEAIETYSASIIQKVSAAPQSSPSPISHSNILENVGMTESATTSPATTTIALDAVKDCSYQTKLFPSYHRLVINEVAWMGTKENSSDEWIELRNASDEPLELEGYQLIDKAEQIKITLPKKILAPGGLYLLERGEEDELTLVADLSYTGALSNSNEGLRLFDRYCFLVDQVEALPKWPAGEATSKKSMERGGGMNWYTFSGAATAGILGTPGAGNSAPTSTALTLPSVPVVVEKVAITEPAVASAAAVIPATASAKLVVSKIQLTGGPGKTTEDFVELYNPGPGQFNLKGYRLVKRTKTGTSDTSLKSWTDDAIVAEGGVYRWANTNYPGPADMRTAGSIADDNTVALRKGSEDTGEVIDAVGWGAAANSLLEGSVFPANPTVGQSLVRKNNQDTDNNSTDFEIQ